MTHPFEALALPDLNGRSMGAKGDVTSLLEPTNLGDSIDSCNPQWYAHGPDDSGSIGSGYVLKGLQPSEVRLVPYFLQHLLYWLSEHGIHRLHVTLSSLSQKISPRLVMVISFRPEIIRFGGNDLLLSLSL